MWWARCDQVHPLPLPPLSIFLLRPQKWFPDLENKQAGYHSTSSTHVQGTKTAADRDIWEAFRPPYARISHIYVRVGCKSCSAANPSHRLLFIPWAIDSWPLGNEKCCVSYRLASSGIVTKHTRQLEQQTFTFSWFSSWNSQVKILVILFLVRPPSHCVLWTFLSACLGEGELSVIFLIKALNLWS